MQAAQCLLQLAPASLTCRTWTRFARTSGVAPIRHMHMATKRYSLGHISFAYAGTTPDPRKLSLATAHQQDRPMATCTDDSETTATIDRVRTARVQMLTRTGVDHDSAAFASRRHSGGLGACAACMHAKQVRSHACIQKGESIASLARRRTHHQRVTLMGWRQRRTRLSPTDRPAQCGVPTCTTVKATLCH